MYSLLNANYYNVAESSLANKKFFFLPESYIPSREMA